MAGQDLGLAIQRRAPGELGCRDPGDERGRSHAAFDQARARLGLNHRALAGPTSVFRADNAQDPEHRRNPIDDVVHVFAYAVKSTSAARTRGRLRLDRHIDARKMLGQGADVATALLPRFRGGLVHALGIPGVVVRRRRANGQRLGVPQTQRQLLGDDNGALFRPRPENDRLQFRDRRLQCLDLALAREYHLDQTIGVAGESFRANRHVGKLSENVLNRQQNEASQPIFVGLRTAF